MLTADVQFRLTANAAAQCYRAQPPFVAYHTVVEIDIPALDKHKRIERAVEARTADDFAVLQDLPRGQRQYGRSFPLSPTFDALSYFRIDYTGARQRDALAGVTMYAPLTFAPPAQAPGVAVVATTLRNYYAHYAADSNASRAHVIMDPLPALTRGNTSDLYLHDLYIDTQTNLPLRVTYAGRDDIAFTLDYTTQQNHWLVEHVAYRRTFYGPLRIGRTSVSADATFDSFSFPATPSDPRVLTSPALNSSQSSHHSNVTQTPPA